MREICAVHDVLFIADEVMTGWGRTGTLLACEHAGIAPDLLCLSKGLTGGSLPLAATLATAEIFDAHVSNDRSKMFFHSSSYTANPIACAAAIANLEIWKDEPVYERVAQLGSRLQARLEKVAAQQLVANPRRLGAVAAFEIDEARGDYLSTTAPDLMSFSRENGVLLRPLGNTVYVMPPYCTTEVELDHIFDTIAAFIAARS